MLRSHGMVPSMSRPANPYDNAACERFMRTLKQEEIDGRQYRSLEELQAQVEQFIEQYYNRQSLHSALGYQTPEQFERSLPPGTGTPPPAIHFHLEPPSMPGRCGEQG